jgi:alpha-amylase
MKIHIAFSRDAEVWRFPIETVSNSEEGFERAYQGSCLLAHWPLGLTPGESWSVELGFSLRES